MERCLWQFRIIDQMPCSRSNQQVQPVVIWELLLVSDPRMFYYWTSVTDDSIPNHIIDPERRMHPVRTAEQSLWRRKAPKARRIFELRRGTSNQSGCSGSSRRYGLAARPISGSSR